MKKNPNDLNEVDKSVYDNIVSSVTANFDLAKQYSNRQCNQCVGKGYFERDYILPGKLTTTVDNKPSRTTAKERKLCFCVSSQVIKQILEIDIKDELE